MTSEYLRQVRFFTSLLSRELGESLFLPLLLSWISCCTHFFFRHSIARANRSPRESDRKHPSGLRQSKSDRRRHISRLASSPACGATYQHSWLHLATARWSRCPRNLIGGAPLIDGCHGSWAAAHGQTIFIWDSWGCRSLKLTPPRIRIKSLLLRRRMTSEPSQWASSALIKVVLCCVRSNMNTRSCWSKLGIRIISVN